MGKSLFSAALIIWLILRHHQAPHFGKDHPLLVLPRWERAPGLPPRRELPLPRGFSLGIGDRYFRGSYGPTVQDQSFGIGIERALPLLWHVPQILSAHCHMGFLPNGKNPISQRMKSMVLS